MLSFCCSGIRPGSPYSEFRYRSHWPLGRAAVWRTPPPNQRIQQTPRCCNNSCSDVFLLRATLPTEGTFGLQGWRWRQQNKGVPRASFPIMLLPTWRSAAAVLLTFLLLIPCVSGLLLLAGSETSSCGMQCGKRPKVCCCRRSGKNAHRAGPGWIESSKCPGGCGQLPAVSATAAARLVAARVEVRPIAPVSRVRIMVAPRRGSSETGFASLERPPPAI
jgi:hypothetical protein